MAKQKRSAYQVELSRQRKEHPELPKKYLQMISRDHINAKAKGKHIYG